MEKVINCFKPRPDAAARLVCFPWAGGGSIHFARWGNVLNSSIEVLAVRLPGRESRAKEPFFQNMQQIVDEVIGQLLPALRERPFALFGHSFGAFTSFAFADALKKRHHLEPVHVFLSGASAPYVRAYRTPDLYRCSLVIEQVLVHSLCLLICLQSEIRLKAPRRSDLSDEDFLQWLTSAGGTPPELLANPEVLQLFLPALKADLHIMENYLCEKPDSAFLSCPVTCLDGKDDAPHDLQAWKDMTSGDFTVRMLDGNHFYLKDPGNEKVILDYMTKNLETLEMDDL